MEHVCRFVSLVDAIELGMTASACTFGMTASNCDDAVSEPDRQVQASVEQRTKVIKNESGHARPLKPVFHHNSSVVPFRNPVAR